MTIIAVYQSFQVEVTDVFTTGDNRKLASVRAITGKPFTIFTHGGPADSATASVRADLLTNVHIDQDN